MNMPIINISMSMSMNFADGMGLLGVLLTIVAYFLLNIQKILAHSLSYTSLNALGSLMILYSLCYHWNFAAFVMESCWLSISLYGMYKSYQYSHKQLLKN